MMTEVAVDGASAERRWNPELTIDCAVYPNPVHPGLLREFMEAPWSDRPFPGPDGYLYPPPGGSYTPMTVSDDRLPGSDPNVCARDLANSGSTKGAVLVPLTRGLMPDIDLGTAICSATNRWLNEMWLQHGSGLLTYLGTIRVNPSDPEGAAREIDDWADNPYMVQVGVPLEAHRPYGDRFYLPIWEAAARHSLPVAVAADGGTGVEGFPTPVGYPRHFAEYQSMYPLNGYYHLSSLIIEGVFDRLPSLRFLFLDGGADVFVPLLWRLDANWRITRDETPWVVRPPSEYITEHIRLATKPLEGPRNPKEWADWVRIAAWDRTQLYASHYPHWDFTRAEDVAHHLSDDVRARVLYENAREFYGDRQLNIQPSSKG